MDFFFGHGGWWLCYSRSNARVKTGAKISDDAVELLCADVGIEIVVDWCRLKITASWREDRPEYPWDGCAIGEESCGNSKPSYPRIVSERSGKHERPASSADAS